MSGTTEKKRGNPSWEKNGNSPNPAGRPKTVNADKRTNKEIRQDLLMQLVRKLRPHQTKAVQTAVNILDNEQASENGKLKAAAMILTLYKDLVKDIYDRNYDTDTNEELQENNAPVFSLRVIGGDEDKKED